ncbi:MAG: redoxin family protein [Bryobacterales bacterium]|nr:redoxin family protein [Bryobacterales bacterium]
MPPRTWPFFFVILAAPLAAQPTAAIRNKLSAGDYYSAESILEVHERDKGQDAAYLDGLAWVLRGAVLMGEWARAEAMDAKLTALLEARLAAGADPAKEAALAGWLGAQTEAHAQIVARRGKRQAVAYLDAQLARFRAPVGLRARLYKRRHLLALEGSRAPEFATEESLTPDAPTLASLKGQRVLVFGWAHWCGDCKAQAAALARARAHLEKSGVKLVALTRFYEADAAAERQAIRNAWAQHYPGLEGVPLLVSTAGMERYGVSSTPTFVLIGANGKVARYLPYRLTQAALEELAAR